MRSDLADKEWLLIGGSAGSLMVTFDLLKALPEKWMMKTVIILHRLKYSKNDLGEIFYNKTGLQIKEIEDGETAENGTVYIVPANYHAFIEDNGCFSLDASEPVCYSRPSINVTFESFARLNAGQCIAILLSGANTDGASGLALLRRKKAITIVQSPLDAEVTTMPEAALKLDSEHIVYTQKEIISFLSILNNHASDKYPHS